MKSYPICAGKPRVPYYGIFGMSCYGIFGHLGASKVVISHSEESSSYFGYHNIVKRLKNVKMEVVLPAHMANYIISV